MWIGAEYGMMNVCRSAIESSPSDLHRYAFTVPPHLLAKIRNFMTTTYEAMRTMLPTSNQSIRMQIE